MDEYFELFHNFMEKSSIVQLGSPTHVTGMYIPFTSISDSPPTRCTFKSSHIDTLSTYLKKSFQSIIKIAYFNKNSFWNNIIQYKKGTLKNRLLQRQFQ